MKIPNYDTNKDGKQGNRRLTNFLDEDFRMLITGQSRLKNEYFDAYVKKTNCLL